MSGALTEVLAQARAALSRVENGFLRPDWLVVAKQCKAAIAAIDAYKPEPLPAAIAGVVAEAAYQAWVHTSGDSVWHAVVDAVLGLVQPAQEGPAVQALRELVEGLGALPQGWAIGCGDAAQLLAAARHTLVGQAEGPREGPAVRALRNILEHCERRCPSDQEGALAYADAWRELKDDARHALAGEDDEATEADLRDGLAAIDRGEALPVGWAMGALAGEAEEPGNTLDEAELHSMVQLLGPFRQPQELWSGTLRRLLAELSALRERQAEDDALVEAAEEQVRRMVDNATLPFERCDTTGHLIAAGALTCRCGFSTVALGAAMRERQGVDVEAVRGVIADMRYDASLATEAADERRGFCDLVESDLRAEADRLGDLAARLAAALSPAPAQGERPSPCIHGGPFPCPQCVANREHNEAATGRTLTEQAFREQYALRPAPPAEQAEPEALTVEGVVEGFSFLGRGDWLRLYAGLIYAAWVNTPAAPDDVMERAPRAAGWAAALLRAVEAQEKRGHS